MKIKLDEIEFRKDLYPRIEFKQELVEKYSNAIEYLPPIKINQSNILIDGWHRWKAHKMAELDEINVEVIETKSEKELKKLAYKWNSNHGLQLSNKEKSNFAIEMIGEMTVKELSESLSVDVRTIQDWTKAKRDTIIEERDRKIIELYLKAENTLDTIAEKIKESRSTVSNIIQTFSKKREISIFGKSFEPYIYNIWNLQKADKETSHFGYFPEIFMANLIYYHTKPFGIVYDPFAGSGSTVDICKKYFRRYYCSDVEVIPGREDDIKQWKIQDGMPDDFKYIRPNLVFLDPPYWKQAEGKYSDSKDDLANMSLEDFYSTLENFLKKITAKKPDKIAIVISPTQYKNENHKFEDHIFKFNEILNKSKYKIEMRYQLPYSTQQYNGNQVEIMKKEKKCISIIRDLVVWDNEL